MKSAMLTNRSFGVLDLRERVNRRFAAPGRPMAALGQRGGGNPDAHKAPE